MHLPHERGRPGGNAPLAGGENLIRKPLRNRQPPVPQVFGFPDRQFDFSGKPPEKMGNEP